jgi:hypothetical protein
MRLRTLVFLVLMAPRLAQAHDFYARECCTDHDCRPAFDGEVTRSKDGWLVTPTGELFPQWATRHSPDGRIHRCSKDADPKAMTICLYVPDLGT